MPTNAIRAGNSLFCRWKAGRDHQQVMGMRVVGSRPDVSRSDPSLGSASRGAVNGGAVAGPGNPWDRFRRWATTYLPWGVWSRLESRRWILAGLLFAALMGVLLVHRSPEIIDLS